VTSAQPSVAGRTDFRQESEYSGYEQLLIARDGSVITVTLNRPELLNAANHGMLAEVTRFFHTVRDDDSVLAIIITGAGKAFCAGGDLKFLRQKIDDAHWYDRIPEHRTRRLIEEILAVPQPIIAAVNGHAIGWGCCLALWCDIVLISEDALIGDPHVRLGLSVPQNAILFALTAGIPQAKRLALMGELVRGSEAANIGLVAKALPADSVLEEARRQASTFAELPPRAVQWTKRVLSLPVKREVLALLEPSLAFEGFSMITDDHREALDAWIEKRPPRYHGR
jgi:enoyl-CoA hydratase